VKSVEWGYLVGLRNYLKNTVKANVNVKSWTNWSMIVSNFNFVRQLVKDIRPQDQEVINSAKKTAQSFDAIVKELGLSEKNLRSRMIWHFINSFACAGLCVFALGWTVKLFLNLMILSGVVGLSLSFLMGVYAVTENLFGFRIKTKNMGLTIREWLTLIFKMK